MLLYEENCLFVFLIFISIVCIPFTCNFTIFQFFTISTSIKVFISNTANLYFAFCFIYVPFFGIKTNFTPFAKPFNKRLACLTIGSATTDISDGIIHLLYCCCFSLLSPLVVSSWKNRKIQIFHSEENKQSLKKKQTR